MKRILLASLVWLGLARLGAQAPAGPEQPTTPLFARVATYLDAAYQYADDTRPAVWLVGWAVADGVRPGVGLYLDGVLTTVPRTFARPDICPVTVLWGWSRCDTGVPVRCDHLYDAVTDCQGYAGSIDLTDLGGWHNVQIGAVTNGQYPIVAFSADHWICVGDRRFCP